MTKIISLTRGKEAIVDDEDYDELNKYKWCTDCTNGIWYAVRAKGKYPRRKQIKMHREIMNAPSDKCVDHINHDGLDNRRNNLRVCTHSENLRNCRMHKNNKSGLIGVSWDKINKKWVAHISKNNKEIHIGNFDNKEDAGIAVDKKAKELFGEIVTINFF